MLTIALKREIPEALKPRRIEIAAAQAPKEISQEERPEPANDQPSQAA
jgi:hypothetical protein